MSSFRARATFIAVAMLLRAPVAEGYDIKAHEVLGELAATRALSLTRSLKQDLGRYDGSASLMRDGSVTLTAVEWIARGSQDEDNPSLRALRHFHDPLEAWGVAGFHVGIVRG